MYVYKLWLGLLSVGIKEVTWTQKCRRSGKPHEKLSLGSTENAKCQKAKPKARKTPKVGCGFSCWFPKKKTATHTPYTLTTHTHMWESLRAHKSSHIARWLRILGIRTNVDDDKAPLKAHLHSATGRQHWPEAEEGRGEETGKGTILLLAGTYFKGRQIAINQARRFAYYLPISLLNFQNLPVCVHLCMCVCLCMWGSFIKICG